MKMVGNNPMELMGKNLTTEKRKYPRFNVDLPVKYSRTTIFFRYGRAVNASEGGLLVYLPEEMRIGQRLALKLFFPSRSEFNTLETVAQVVWKNVHLRKDWTWDYRTGVKFLDIPPEHMAQLKNFLVSIAQRPSSTA
jgi:c-di-GMP-binding flagellar brake protein YcgR